MNVILPGRPPAAHHNHKHSERTSSFVLPCA